jgi:hypothetical protein
MDDEDTKQLQELVKDLVLNKGISHKSIKLLVQQSIEEAVKTLPDIPVLYCACYGGYGYSTQYKDFKREYKARNTLSNEHEKYISNNHCFISRVQNVQIIEAYGKQCELDFPGIAKMITIYNTYNLSEVYADIAKYCYYLDEINGNKMVAQLVSSTSEAQFGENISVNYVPYFKYKLQPAHLCSDILKYSKTALEEKIEKDREKFSELHIELEMKLDSSKVHKCWKKMVKIFKEEKELKETMQKLSFMDAIKYYSPEHFAIWKCQNIYNEEAMHFLLREDIDVLDVDNATLCDGEHYRKIGCLFGSGRYCQLEIGYVRPYIDWRINEYDSKEQIVVY